MERIGDILSRNQTPVLVKNGTRYKQVTIRTNYKGVVLRGSQDGSAIGTKNQFAVSGGQFILSRIDARNGAFGIVPDILDGAIVTSDFLAFDINDDKVHREFFNVFLQSPMFLEACIKASRGNTNRKRVQEDFLLGYEITLPSLPNQHRLITRIDRGRASILEARHELNRQKSLLTNLRQAVLHEAIQGKLTGDWREDHPDVEAAGSLLERIRDERASLISSKRLRAETPLRTVGIDEQPFALPNSWAWCRFGDLTRAYEAGSSFKCAEREVEGSEWGVLKTSAITSGRFIERENKYLRADAPTDITAKVSIGDLIFCRASGSKGLAGTCALVHESSRNLLLSDKTIRIRLMDGISQQYVALHNGSVHSRSYYGTLSTGKSTSMNNVTRGELLNKALPLPPLEEQQVIVERVEALMRKCDTLQLEIARAELRSDQLLKAVLREAFAPAPTG